MMFIEFQQCNRAPSGPVDHGDDRQCRPEGPSPNLDSSVRWCRNLRGALDPGETGHENDGRGLD